MTKRADLQIGQTVRVRFNDREFQDVTIGGFAEMEGAKLLLTRPGFFKGEANIIVAHPLDRVTHVLTPVEG